MLKNQEQNREEEAMIEIRFNPCIDLSLFEEGDVPWIAMVMRNLPNDYNSQRLLQ